MLRELSIHHLALIDSLELTLDVGFTCLTGETGAGKSILLDAVGLLLGSRGSAELIRTGEERAIVEGLFDLSPKTLQDAQKILGELGIEIVSSELLISREINRSGKSSARVNGRLITVQWLRELGRILIQQHGQHDSLTLLKKDEQLRLLDDFHSSLITPVMTLYQSAYHEYLSVSKLLSQAEHTRREQAQRIDFLRMQLSEIDAANVKIGEEGELLVKKSRLQHAERLQSIATDVYSFLYEGTGRVPGANGELYRLLKEVQAAKSLDKDLQELMEYLDTAQVHLAEAAEFARTYRDKMNFEPEQLMKIEDRLAVLSKLFRKYGETEQEVLHYREQAAKEMKDLEHLDERLAEWQQRKIELYEQLVLKANALTQERVHAAKVFEEKMQITLARLSMPGVRFHILVSPVPYSDKGADEVDFMFSANQGEELKPLAKIASGGELSRFMLALAKVRSGLAPFETMIFDEIDTGISGSAAQRVAEEIAHISSYHQVFCVTHQAQMACMADVHLLIEKRVSNERTYTFVKKLVSEERVTELAKMLGGQLVTETTLQHARELIMRKQLLTQ